MDIKFDCSQCGQPLLAAESSSGQNTECPACGRTVTVPDIERAPPMHAPNDTIFCTKCGHPNGENNFKCIRCGFVLHAPPRLQYVASDGKTMGGLIPYKNPQALWAYYLGVFALIPFIGIPLGIAALILGCKGLKYAKQHPEVQGKGHAWTGIILGTLSAIAYTLLVVVPVIIISGL